jgi:excisionase family DNA binding protein
MCGMEKLLNTTETAERLGISARRVLQLIETGKLAAQKVGRDYAISAQSLEAVKIHGKAGRPPKADASPIGEKPAPTPKRAAKNGGKV